MKLKKFFAGVLAAAMMLTVGATAAFATGSTITLDGKEYSDAQTVTVKRSISWKAMVAMQKRLLLWRRLVMV